LQFLPILPKLKLFFNNCNMFYISQ
jgi:hypothetical protein